MRNEIRESRYWERERERERERECRLCGGGDIGTNTGGM